MLLPSLEKGETYCTVCFDMTNTSRRAVEVKNSMTNAGVVLQYTNGMTDLGEEK